MTAFLSGFQKINRVYFYLLLILILAFSFRVGRCIASPYMDKDSILYISIADTMASDGSAHAFDRNGRIPPLYPMLMAAVHKYSGINMAAAGLIVSVLSGGLLVLAAFSIGSMVFRNNYYGLAAAFFTAVNPTFITISQDIMRDSLFVTLSAFALMFALQSAFFSYRLAYIMPMGFFTGLAICTRSEGALLIMIFCIWIFIEVLINIKNIKWLGFLKKSFAGFIIFWFFFGAVVLPVKYMLENSSSSWTVFDPRISNYMGSIFSHFKK